MREIKFRVYNLDANKMIADGVGLEDIHMYVDEGDNITEREGNEIVQFTGLHDRNGKEIYEGDILTVELVYGQMKGEVIYEDGGIFVRLNYKPMNDGTNLVKPLQPYLHRLNRNGNIGEVIGNIYEDGDLID